VNVIDYGEAGISLSCSVILKLYDVDSKYVRFSLNKDSTLSYQIVEPEHIETNDYVIRLDSSTHLVISSQVYSKVLNTSIDVREGLKGTELYIK